VANGVTVIRNVLPGNAEPNHVWHGEFTKAVPIVANFILGETLHLSESRIVEAMMGDAEKDRVLVNRITAIMIEMS